MNATTKNTSAQPRRGAMTALLAILVVMALGAAVTASADPRQDRDRNNGRNWNEHARQARNWHRGHRERYNPGYVYAPPPVVYAPAYPSPGINIILPLDFR